VVYKTKGVVFRFTRFGESSIIVTIFTEQFGLQSYIVNGIRSKTSRSKIALFQPLTLLELVVYHRENANINRIKEVKCLHPYQSIQGDIIKSSVAMFITEVINKSVKEESHASHLFEFLCSSFITLDTLVDNSENFHLVFLIKLSRFLGFGAQSCAEILGGRVTSSANEMLITQLLKSDYLQPFKMPTDQRREVLELLVYFYNEHGGVLGDLKSMQVLRDLMK
jgi:DNA repair protein RecO (recombination protein O)